VGVVIAIDGPAGSGKSTVARALAARLGFNHLDTGAMYRAVAYAALDRAMDLEDGAALAAVARSLRIEVGDQVMVDGVDATGAIRGPEVTAVVSAVAAHPEVRRELVHRQREWVGAREGWVVEGRDIATVVFPDATLKIFLTASAAERAGRRTRQDDGLDSGAVAADLARRDRHDAGRVASPLQIDEGAVVIDTTDSTVDQVVEQVIGLL